jgi:hypothetical protein
MLASRSMFWGSTVRTKFEGTLKWRKARKCDGGACVEIAKLGETIMVRNSTTPDEIISTSRDQWLHFLVWVREDSFG